MSILPLAMHLLLLHKTALPAADVPMIRPMESAVTRTVRSSTCRFTILSKTAFGKGLIFLLVSLLFGAALLTCLADPVPPEMVLTDLRCELAVNAAIDRTTPRLSWQVRSPARAKRQCDYEILVASAPARLTTDTADLWRSGRVNSAQSINVLYAGNPLVSRQRCYWQVRVWDEKGQPSAWSSTATWEMGLLKVEDWTGSQWIRHGQTESPLTDGSGSARGPAHRLSFPSPLLRKEFTTIGKVRRATAYVCGLGYHELYVNGQRIGDEVLEPAQTTYDMRAFYVVRDITAPLREGSNCVGLWLGNGFYGENLALGGSLAYGQPLARAVIYIEYEDGRLEVLGTDATWRTEQSPIQFDNVYWGETYDSRLVRPGWSAPGFQAADWVPAEVVLQPPTKELVVEDIPPSRRLETWAPKAITPGKDGRWIVDFGRNFAGWVRLKDLPTRDGQKITLRFAEQLTPDETDLDTDSTDPHDMGDAQIEIYIGDGKPATWEPRFSYHGFRYIDVTGLGQQPEAQNFEAVRVGTDLEPAGTFMSSDSVLNRIYDTSLWTIRNNLCGQSEDCPHREKCAWLGDAHAMGEAAILSLGMERFWSKFCDDDETTLGKDRTLEDRIQGPPGLPANISVGKRLCGAAKADWGAAMVLLPWYLYLYDGNTDVAARQYSHMKDWVEHVESIKRGGLVEDGWGDWCPPGSNAMMDTPPVFTSTALHVACTQVLAQMAQALGHAEDVPEFKRMADETRAHLIAKFYLPDGGYQTQTENSVALRFSLYPDGKRRQVEDALQRAINAKHSHYSTGIHGARWLYTGLADAGKADLALTMLRQPDFPSYAYTLAQGFTTWPEFSMPSIPGKAAEGSLDHPMQSTFAAFFHEALLGIRPDPKEPGFRHALLRPEGFGSLSAASGSHRTPYGEITSHWRVDGEKFVWNIVLPANTTATIWMPASIIGVITESGQPAETSVGVRKTGEENGRVVFEVGSGTYEFQSFAAELHAAASSQVRDLQSETWVATDALGRVLPGPTEAGPPRRDRTVGMFYFLTADSKARDGGPYNNTEILRDHPQAIGNYDDPAWGPPASNHYWGEPLFGYYASDDESVLRKHAQMLSAAGVDVLIFDVSNSITYDSTWKTLCRVFSDIRRQGGQTPQIAFLCPFSDWRHIGINTLRHLYDTLYAPGQFADLWFQWRGKPLIIADTGWIPSPATERDQQMRDFFTFRNPIALYDVQSPLPGEWAWLQVYPQAVQIDPAGFAEEMSVSVAQNYNATVKNTAPMSFPGAFGRSYHSGNLDTHPDAVRHGLNFAEQWERVLQADPPFTFITGWNEWTAGFYQSWTRWHAPPPVFVDEFTQEYSRDIEPMKGGHGDDYYYQLVDYIRRYKGVPPLPAVTQRSIPMDGSFDAWQSVAPEFRDAVGDPVHRNHPGYGKAGTYRNDTGRNDIVTAKVCYDQANVYFYVQTKDPLTPCTDPNWMMLFLDTDADVKTGWLGYDFVVNRLAPKDGQAFFERHVADAGYRWDTPIAVPFQTRGNELAIAIPRVLLGVGAPPAHIDFKWADNCIQRADWTDFTLNGDAAPDDRFNFRAKIGEFGRSP